MDKRDKLGCGIIVGGTVWIGASYLLMVNVSDERLVAALVAIGLGILIFLVAKYLRIEKANDQDRPF